MRDGRSVLLFRDFGFFEVVIVVVVVVVVVVVIVVDAIVDFGVEIQRLPRKDVDDGQVVDLVDVRI